MAAANGDIVRMTVQQRQAGQTVLNVYHYQVVTLTGLGGDYLDVVADWYEETMHPGIKGIQHSALSYIGLKLENVTNGIDFIERPLNDAGASSTGDALPPNLCWTFRLLRETLATRHGYKRYAGVPEANQNNGAITGITNAAMQAIADTLAADIMPAPAVIPLLAPVIVRKNASGTIVAVNNIGGADFRGLGTQNTRKIGRGI